MGLIESIKKSAASNRTKFQTSEASTLEKIFNNMFYVEKNIEAESKFIRHVMTRGGETQERTGLHASNILVGEKEYCLRAQVLSIFYKQLQGDEITPGLKRIFEEGNAIHEKWQRLFIRAGYAQPELCDKTCYHEKYAISFSPDIIAFLPDFYAEPMVVEIKSVNTFQFQKMIKHPKAWKQCQFYMHLTGLKKGIVLSEDKNTQDFLVEVYDYTPSLIQPYIDRAKQIQEATQNLLENKHMVPRPAEATTPSCLKCNQCVMKDACWNIGMGRVRLNND